MSQDFYTVINQLLSELDTAERIGDEETAEKLSQTLVALNPHEEIRYELLPTR